MKWLRYNLETAARALGDQRISEITAQEVATWRKSLPESRRHPAHRALRQVLEAALRWKWIEDNPATLVKNPAPRVGEIDPFDSWEEIEAIVAELDLVHGVLVEFLVGGGMRPEEAFGADWTDVDLKGGIFTVRRAFAKGRLKSYAKTERSRRRVPLRGPTVLGLRYGWMLLDRAMSIWPFMPRATPTRKFSSSTMIGASSREPRKMIASAPPACGSWTACSSGAYQSTLWACKVISPLSETPSISASCALSGRNPQPRSGCSDHRAGRGRYRRAF